MSSPIPARGSFPYLGHRTVAQVDEACREWERRFGIDRRAA
jgi:hypothetical protein